MPEISFLVKGIRFKLSNKRKTSRWLEKVAKSEGRQIHSLTYVFASDAFVGSYNFKFLGHNAYTDIITFDYTEGNQIIGEIYISIPRVRDNARTYKQPFQVELRRVVVHGLLHLLGFTDKTQRQVAQMRLKEEACLSLWQSST